MGRKPKVDTYTKLRLVEKYLEGNLRFEECLKISESSRTSFKSWGNKYRCKGSDILINLPTNKTYSEELKFNSVNDYLN